MNIKEAKFQMNLFGKQKIPFLFIIDFEMKNSVVLPVQDAKNENILFNINEYKNYDDNRRITKKIEFEKYAVNFERYSEAFDIVQKNLHYGNSYLLNLTLPTQIKTNLSFSEIFNNSKAKYKLLFNDKFVVFSPEIFVQISDGEISSFPMKGTIDAAITDAENKILQDKKELAEHNTIVDLIRNDLSMVAKNVKVDKFRYLDMIKTSDKELLQVSSKISGRLDLHYNNRIGDIMFTLLPAGSISGAPKKKTVEIIKEAEKYERGYYSGIFGYFDGNILDSGVMIRYIEKINNKLFFKSGGGITVNSNLSSEYNELIDKVYVPIT